MFEIVLALLNKVSAIVMSFLVALGAMGPGSSLFPFGNNKLKQTKVMDIAKIDDYRTVEGGCTDGRYIYVSLLNPEPEEDPTSCIIKIDSKTMKIVDTVKDLHIDHANDMTYNPTLGKVVICNNMPHRNVVTFFDPVTMTITESKTIDTDLFAIEYVQSSDSYYCGIANSYNYAKFNSDFVLEETYTGIDNGFTRQAMTIKNNEVYNLYYKTNCIYRYDMKGNFTGDMTLPVAENEAEDLFFIGDTLYVTYNVLGKDNGGEIYKVENLKFENVPENYATMTDAPAA